jgi:methionine-rich copper-binding protein CopC
MRKILVLLITVIASITLSSVAAQAHTSKPTLMVPEENAEIEVMPNELVLGFSENLIQSGAAVSVLDPSGTQLVRSLPKVDGNSISATVASSTYKGKYRVTYKVTSSDGAVNQGTYSVYIVNGEDYDPRVAASGQEPEDTLESTSIAAASTVDSESENYNYILLLGGGVAVLVGAFLYYRKPSSE